VDKIFLRTGQRNNYMTNFSPTVCTEIEDKVFLRSLAEFFRGDVVPISPQLHIIFSSETKLCLDSFSLRLSLPYTGSA